MIQLKVYDSPYGSPQERETIKQTWLDLYETEPIKLTLSIEDIQNADATSTYSKAFKVPGTRNNAEFFKNSFDVDDTMFDVTTKKPAEILVDGAEFKQGHVRLQKVFLNTELDRYDYELLFLGETRDFSSLIGDRGLCELQLTDLIGGPSGTALVPNDIVTSWQAYPQNASLTAGLHNGNIIYPLIDHGNTYNAAGVVQQTRIALAGTPRFTQNNNPVTLDRFKPMIRAKRIWDQIFANAGYTYDSNFINSDLFHQIYISAFGNEATIGWENGGSSPTSSNIAHAQQNSSDWGYQLLPQAIIDPTSSTATPNIAVVNISTPGGAVPVTRYKIPTSGEYQIAGQCFYNGWTESSDYVITYVSAAIYLWNITTNSVIINSPFGYGGTLQFNQVLSTLTTPNFNVGDEICLVVGSIATNSAPDQYTVTNVALDVITAPGNYNPVTALECTYKQIDFIKDILTAFRLVLAPDANKPQNFIVEPWQEYINSGQLRDWSDKLVENKDFQIEPVFFTQAAEIDFKFQPGGDYANVYHQQAYQEPYGWLQFNANNDLLKGKREIKLIGIAPTILTNIEDGTTQQQFIIPQMHTHSQGDGGGLEHLPIKAKTRMMFYNGLQAAAVTWHLDNATPEARTTYPLVSPYQTWPILPNTLNLNFANDVQYWGQSTNLITGISYNQQGATLYDNYWSRYINSLYGKYSRRVTANFVLNNIDLNEFTFDDTIFVNGTYYIPEKIIDVEVGAYTEVKVQLLTANDFRPQVIPNQVLFVNTITGVGGPCALGPGSILVNTNGTPGFTWYLSNGQTGSALNGVPVGAPSYDFDIINVSPGTYTITIVDSLGRTDTQTVTVPASSASFVTATQVVTNASSCTTCNGAITVTPAGGTAPYTIDWYDGPSTSFTRTGLCPGQYSYTVYDSLGCAQQSYVANITCPTVEGTIWKFYRSSTDCSALSTVARNVFYPTGTSPMMGEYYDLNDLFGQHIKGCWTPVFTTTDPADAVEVAIYASCAACQGIPENVWLMKNCETGQELYVPEVPGLVLGTVWKLSVSKTDCWEAMGLTFLAANATVTTGPYTNCIECGGPSPVEKYVYRLGYYDSIETCTEVAATGYYVSSDTPLTLNDTVKVDGSATGGAINSARCYWVGPPNVTPVNPALICPLVTLYTSCDECVNGLQPVGMLTNKGPQAGASNPFCAAFHPIDIWNSATFDPYNILIGSIMYADAAKTTTWSGDNEWYSIADPFNASLAAVSVRISGTGEVTDIVFCA